MGTKEYILTHLYCGRCMRWNHIETVKWNNRGQPVCPICHTVLRIKSRHNRHRNPKLMELKARLIEQIRSVKMIV